MLLVVREYLSRQRMMLVRTYAGTLIVLVLRTKIDGPDIRCAQIQPLVPV
jgi:hypothetical protein